MLNQKVADLIESQSQYLKAKSIDKTQLVFEERVRLNCFQCARYGVNWTCPPKLPDIDYQKMILEYQDALLVYCKVPFTEDKLDIVRRDSTNVLHRALLAAEKLLWENDRPLAVSFIGGSCKLCAQGCDPHKCRQRKLARIPIEATGVNVSKSVKDEELQIVFPPKNFFYRVGLLLW